MGTMPDVVQVEEIAKRPRIPGDEAEDVQKRLLEDKWIPQVESDYPNLCDSVHFVPPVHINKMTDDPSGPGRAGEVSRAETRNSDFRDDRAQLMIMRFVWKLSELLNRREKTAMMVLSKFNLDHYLNKQLSGSSGQKKKGKRGKNNDPKARVFFPTPSDPKLARGEFDVLIVHKKYGFISIEVKAIGDLKDFTEEKLGKKITEEALGKEITSVLTQINKRQRQLDAVTQDLIDESKIPVTKMAAFPNLTRDKLSDALNKPNFSGTPDQVHDMEARFHDQLKQYLSNDLDLSKALTLWLSQDEVTSAAGNDDVMMAWWNNVEHYMTTARFSGIDDEIYKRIIARFCGPHSTVEVYHCGGVIHEARSVGEGVHEMGAMFNRLVLTKDQIALRSSEELFMYLTGPPGSGKTLLLMLKAMMWVDEGDTVVIVRGPGNLPGHLISQDLYQKTVFTLNDKDLADSVQLETVTADTDPAVFVEEMVRKNAEAAGGGKVRFLVDELWLARPKQKFLNLTEEIIELLEKVKAFVTGPSPGGAPSSTTGASASVQPPVSASEPIPPMNAEPDTRTMQNLLDALGDIVQKEVKWTSVHDLAKAVVNDEDVKEQLTQLFSVVRELLEALPAHADQLEAFKSSGMFDNVLDAQFYVDVLQAWLASPVLHQVMQEVRHHQGTGLWCTGFWAKRRPEGYTIARLRRSLRCPAHVQKMLDQTEHLASHQDTKQYEYETTSTETNPPLPAEGPPYALQTYIDHGKHVQRAAAGQTAPAELKCVSQCEKCGQKLASVLLEKLSIGSIGKLQFRDVLIVSRSLLPIKPHSPFVRALREFNIPVKVVVRGGEDLQDGDLESDSVLIANTYNSHGLERKVVVFVPDIKSCSKRDGESDGNDGGCDDGNEGGGGGGDGDGFGDDGSDFDSKMVGVGDNNRMGVWFIASRCLAHVVLFHV